MAQILRPPLENMFQVLGGKCGGGSQTTEKNNMKWNSRDDDDNKSKVMLQIYLMKIFFLGKEIFHDDISNQNGN